MPFHPAARGSSYRLRRREDGYILLALLLMVSLMTIAAFAVLPTIAFEIRRDREQELIHRGVQYSRAIRNYYKKFSRYPTRRLPEGRLPERTAACVAASWLAILPHLASG